MKAVDPVAALPDSSYRVDLRITIPEGWTASQVYERIASNLDISIEEVEEAGESVGESLPEDAEGNLEGWLAPSTYTVAPGQGPEDVLTQQLERTKNTLKDLDVDEKDQQELLIKASIVEKEVPEQYRPQVARVIENRLEGRAGDKTLGMDTTLACAFGKQYSGIPETARDESGCNTRDNQALP